MKKCFSECFGVFILCAIILIQFALHSPQIREKILGKCREILLAVHAVYTDIYLTIFFSDLEYNKANPPTTKIYLPDGLKNSTDPSHRKCISNNLYELCETPRESSLPHKIKHAPWLKCWYHNWHPLLLLQPVKAERITFRPDLVFFHNIVSPDIIKQIKLKAQLQGMEKSSIQPPNWFRKMERLFFETLRGGREYRKSWTAWLQHSEIRELQKLATIVSVTTGLHWTTYEPLQVVNYENDGYYDPHLDCFTLSSEVNRLATMLFYLSEPSAGGETVFPCVDISIVPRLGGAAFWYNLDESGYPDPLSMHLSCDLKSGEKWIANWWMRERSWYLRHTRPSLQSVYNGEKPISRFPF